MEEVKTIDLMEWLVKSTKESPPRRVVCAAIRYPDGVLVLAPRHGGPACRKQQEQVGKPFLGPDQGFIDQHGVFMDREEALEVALAADQITRPEHVPGKELFSEALY